MPKTKEQCPECCTFTVSFTSSNCDYIYALQAKLKSKKKRNVSFENAVNEIIALQAIKDDHKI